MHIYLVKGKQKMSQKFIVNIPSTSANLGSCFDFAGVAIPDLYNTVEAELGQTQNIITVEGMGAETIPTDERNLIYRTFKGTYEYANRKCPYVKLHCINRIPLNRGLGSSAAATLGGIFAANATMDNALSKDDMLKIACEYEGHPDNAAPAIYGGIVISAYINGNPIIKHISIPSDLYVAIAVPEVLLSTSVSRGALPESYQRKDVVSAMANSALAVDSLHTGDYALFGKLIMEDVVHIPYRRRLIKGYDDVVDAAVKAGAYGTVISGAGSTMISYCRNAETAEAVKSAMLKAFDYNDVDATGFTSIIKGV